MEYRFVDCRWALDDPGFGLRAYREGHIPGAAFLDVERDLASPPGAGGRHPLPSAAQFGAAASRAGIGDETFVVAYGSLGGAERLWWLLRHFGHGACAVLDFDAWHGPLAGGDEPSEPAVFEPREQAGGRSSPGSARGSSSSTRGSSRAGAASRTPSTASRDGFPAR
jgi:thiosulfate/3-mercaptopyruvate sulfurtransferase